MKSKDNSDGSLDGGSTRGDSNTSTGSSGGISFIGGTTPIPKGPPLRLLADNWGEYFSPERNRYFYYNAEEKKTSWKPPRSSSNNRRSDECLATSSSVTLRSGASTLGSSIDNSLDNLCEELDNSLMMDVSGSRNSIIGSGSIIGISTNAGGFRSNKPDILHIPSSVGSSRKSVAALSTEELNNSSPVEKSPRDNQQSSDNKHNSSNNSSCGGGILYGGSSSSVFDSQENLVDTSGSPHQHHHTQEEEFSFANLTASIPIPEGWEECWDESIQQLYYVNKVTGAKVSLASCDVKCKKLCHTFLLAIYIFTFIIYVSRSRELSCLAATFFADMKSLSLIRSLLFVQTDEKILISSFCKTAR